MLKKKIYNSYIKELTYIFFLAFFLFIGKWIFSFYYFNEDLGIKIILESQSDGYFYFPVPKPFELGLIFGTGTEKLLDFYVKEDPAIIKDFIFNN